MRKWSSSFLKTPLFVCLCNGPVGYISEYKLVINFRYFNNDKSVTKITK